jgi:hypothetical protein
VPRDQQQESESEPADGMDAARRTADVETHAGLIVRAEEKLKYRLQSRSAPAPIIANFTLLVGQLDNPGEAVRTKTFGEDA